ncbi:MAG: NrfD/PsrC family molybdoenzyme membrane anchor subunit [Dehalococcoidia bacterium]|nr:NrfD/PsrC family molybdoenzyme membrane anchor subunit [Dehalococcoidia bacterium]
MATILARHKGPDKTLVDLMRPVTASGKGSFFFLAAMAALFGLYIIVFYMQYVYGHGSVTDQATPVGAAWGLYVTGIVFFIGISHVGIGVSAAARLLNLDYLKPYARMAEMLTLVCLPAAVLIITLDIGRPEKFLINVMTYGRIQAPFVWSGTVISVYLAASLIYLYLSMRRDITLSADLVPEKWRWFYRLLSLGYKDTEDTRHTHERTLWWMAIVLIPIMVSVHSVYGLVFGLHSGRPGWFNPLMAPYFVLGALVNGFATLVIVAALIRRVFRWEQYLSLKAIRNMGRFLCWMTLLYIYFSVSEYITFIYSPPAGEARVAHAIFLGEFSKIFWPTLAILITGFLVLFFNQTIFNKQFALWATVLGAVFIDIALFLTRYLIVVPSLLYPLLPFPKGSYVPTVYEFAALIGVFGFAIGVYALFMRVFPIVEFPHPGEQISTEANKW